MSDAFFSQLDRLPSRTRSLRAGALLFERGDPVKSLFRITHGEVHLLRRQVDGAAYILQRAGQGAMIAEASLMSKAYHCAAVAIQASSLMCWSRGLVRKMIAENPELAEAYAAHLAQEVRQARLRAEITSLRRTAERLDAWLIWHDGEFPAKGQWHRVAQDINVTPEALYRELAKRRRSANGS